MARSALPNEMCALIGGRRSDSLEFELVVGVRNSAKSPDRFALDGAEMLAAEDRIEHAGLEVVGIAHSHPVSEAKPSDTDLADAVTYDPESSLVHVIVSMQGFTPAIRAWRYPTKRDQRVREVAFRG